MPKVQKLSDTFVSSKEAAKLLSLTRGKVLTLCKRGLLDWEVLDPHSERPIYAVYKTSIEKFLTDRVEYKRRVLEKNQ